MNEYAVRVAAQLRRRYAHEPEYLQCVLTWLEMIDPALDDPRYEKLDLLTRMVEPERMFTFLVPGWMIGVWPTPATATAPSSAAPSVLIRAGCASIRG